MEGTTFFNKSHQKHKSANHAFTVSIGPLYSVKIMITPEKYKMKGFKTKNAYMSQLKEEGTTSGSKTYGCIEYLVSFM